MAQRDYEEQPEAPDLGAAVELDSVAAAQAARDVRADGEVFAPGLPGERAAEEVDATRIDRAPESGGAGAGVDGRQDAGPDIWR
jgi:hypothetical protein